MAKRLNWKWLIITMAKRLIKRGKSGSVRSEGLINSCTSVGMKVGIGLGSAVLSWILAFGGYDGTAATQTASAVASIKFSYGYLGAICAVVCLVLILLINIDKNIKEIQSDLQAKRIK
ncbi:MAG: hypothetical protein ACFWTJ_01625 [Lachnoclostridium sp.]